MKMPHMGHFFCYYSIFFLIKMVMKHILPTWLSINRATWLIVAFFCLMSVWQLWVYFQPVKVPGGQYISSTSRPNVSVAINRERVTKSPYFGQYLPDDGNGIQQADLDFELVGVLYSEDPNDSQVIVRQSNQEEKFYHINNTLPGGAVVKKVTENSVIILYDGKLQQLSLPKDSLAFEAKPKAHLIKE